MPHNNYQYTHFSINNLLDIVKKKANVEITCIGDCELLSASMSKAGYSISKDTLGRLYKVIKSKSMPSKYTLNLLAEYVGYKTWNEYFKHTENNIDIGKNFNNKSEKANESELTLLNFCIHDNAYNPIINYLNQNLDIFEYPYTLKSFDILNLFDDNIRDNHNARYKLLEIINSNEVLRDIYFKFYVNIDGLNRYYAEFIEKKYLDKLNPVKKHYKLNFIWAKSILITSYLYSNKIKKMLRTGYDLFRKYEPKNETIYNYIIDGEIHFYPYSRFHYANILYAHFSQKNNSHISNIIQLVSDDLRILNISQKTVVLAQIFEALTVANKQEIIGSFSAIVKDIMMHIKNFSDRKNEPESLIQMCYYYNSANNIQNCIDVSDKFVVPEMFDNKNYINTYAYYYNALKSLMLEGSEVKAECFNKAFKHACKMNNKFLSKLT